MLAPTTPDRILYRKTLNRMGWSMMVFVVTFSTLSFVPAFVSELRVYITSPVWNGIFTALYGILATVCYIAPFFLTGMFYYAISRRLRTERPSLEIKLSREFPLLVLAGLAILTAGAYMNQWFCSVTGFSVPEDLIIMTESYDTPSTIIMYMSVAIAPAFAEEFLFRGVFYSNLRPFGRTQAVLISSLLFALMHQNVGQLFYTFVAGIAMALMYELTGSIWCSVIFHLFNNELAVLTDVIRNGWCGEAAVPYLALWDMMVLVTGVISIMLLIVYYKKQADCQKKLRVSGVFGTNNLPMDSCDVPLSFTQVVKGALAPGMIVFTAETVVNMALTWLLLAVMNGGNFW